MIKNAYSISTQYTTPNIPKYSKKARNKKRKNKIIQYKNHHESLACSAHDKSQERVTWALGSLGAGLTNKLKGLLPRVGYCSASGGAVFLTVPSSTTCFNSLALLFMCTRHGLRDLECVIRKPTYWWSTWNRYIPRLHAEHHVRSRSSSERKLVGTQACTDTALSDSSTVTVKIR